MKTRTYFRYILQAFMSVLLLLFNSCNSFLEMDPPKTELITPVVFSSNSTANAAMLSIYARMASATGVPSREIPLRTGLLSDEFTSYTTNQQLTEFYTNTLSINNSNVLSAFWTPYYNLIFQCNAILEGLENNKLVSESVSKQIIGEAKFIRAYYHFYLLNLFGEIPTVKSTDYRINERLSRSTHSEVYKFILEDLVEAKALLNENYVGPDALTTSTERVRPNKATVQAFLARVYLFMKDYENAEKEATAVIENTRFSLPNNLAQLFLKTSTEAIWQLQPYLNNFTTEADIFVLTGIPSSGVAKFVTISDALLSLYESSDMRRTNWIGNIVVSGKTYYFPNKYKVASGTNTTEYSTIFRLSELYLIRSEARVHIQNIENSIADLNMVRARAKASVYDWKTVVDPLALIAKERQLELFSEGHRWFDLIRTEKVNEVMTIAAPIKGSIWTSTASLLPIPQLERDKNTNLSQNDGY